MKDEHVMETLGMSRVVIRDGKVVSVTEPKLTFCPLFHKYKGIEKITKDIIKDNIEARIKDYGLFTENRDLLQNVFVGFGTSEIFMSALRRGTINAVICACDGAGTVISDNPELVQGIGARLSGLVSTTPIGGIIERIGKLSGEVLDPENAIIDQFQGVNRALELGYTKVGVTITDPSEAKRVKDSFGEKAITFLVHTSGLCFRQDVLDGCDLVTSCASNQLRERLKGHIMAQAGSSIPIFALSQIGKDLLLDRAKDIERPVFVAAKELPFLEGRQPEEMF
jgi:putative methanogenesis marker protein 8